MQCCTGSANTVAEHRFIGPSCCAWCSMGLLPTNLSAYTVRGWKCTCRWWSLPQLSWLHAKLKDKKSHYKLKIIIIEITLKLKISPFDQFCDMEGLFTGTKSHTNGSLVIQVILKPIHACMFICREDVPVSLSNSSVVLQQCSQGPKMTRTTPSCD